MSTKGELELKTTDSEFHSLHKAIQKTRLNSSTVRVDITALTHILMDHSHMVAKLKR